jgi:DNA-binding transcriptional LysR family regulator
LRRRAIASRERLSSNVMDAIGARDSEAPSNWKAKETYMKRRDALSSVLDCKILAAFVRVVDTGNISAAARSLFLAQSAVSTQMSVLSRAAGVPLLERTHGRWQVTASGAVFYRRAVEILRTVELLQRELTDVSEFGHVTIGSTRTITDTILPSIVAEFSADHPEIRLEIVSGDREDIQQRLANDDIDAALAALPVQIKNVRLQVFDRDRLVLLLPRAHCLAARPSLTFEEIAAEPFVVFDRGSGVRALLEERLGDRFAALDVRFELTSNDALVRFVAAGLGLTFLPERAAETWARVLPIVPKVVTDVDLERELAFVVPDNRVKSDALAAFERWMNKRFGDGDNRNLR